MDERIIQRVHDNKTIIDVQRRHDAKLLNEAVYTRLEKQVPTLRDIICTMRNPCSVELLILGYREQPQQINGGTEEEQHVLDALYESIVALRDFTPVVFEKYAKMAEAITALAKQRTLQPRVVVQDQKLMASVNRKIFGSNSEALAYHENIDRITRANLKSLSRCNHLFGPMIPRCNPTIPDEKAIDILQHEVMQYRLKEIELAFPVIYAYLS